jgi:chemotaxis protein MotB
MRSLSKKHKKSEEPENHERWLVSYADFITLLFAFFVVMYATSNSDLEKQKKFEDSVKSNFSLNVTMQGQGAGAAPPTVTELVPELKSPLGVFPRQGGPQEMQDYVNRFVQTKMQKQGAGMVLSQQHDLVGARISLAASSFFPTGSSKLKYSALKVLDQVAELLKETDKKVIIEGHTDDQIIQPQNNLQRSLVIESNWELASLRATSVVRYLIKYHGIEAKRLAAISYADQRPIVANNSDENRAKNRRIDILIVADENE